MKIFHISDLHIGMQLHHYNLKEDQEAILDEVISYAREFHPDVVVIAGDIYDKSIPSAEAVTVFDRFLTGLSAVTPAIEILIISGNHDSADRLAYASRMLKKNHIHIAGQAPVWPEDHICKITVPDHYGEVDFYLLPFLKPSYVKNVWEKDKPKSYGEAVERLIARENIDFINRRNVLVSHQFYMGGNKVKTCGSETISVGGIDQIDIEITDGFDYVALGHLHGAQSVGRPTARYCGSLLKYSVSECEHLKTLTFVELKEKGEALQIRCLPMHPMRDVKKKRGLLKEIIGQASEDERQDYVSVTLTDEADPYKPKDRLENVFHNILEVRIENARTRNKLNEADQELMITDPLTLFEEFFHEIQGREMTEEERGMLRSVFDRLEGE